MNSLIFSQEKLLVRIASKLGSWYREKFVEKSKIKVKSKDNKKVKRR